MERNANDTFGSSNTGESSSGNYGSGTAGSANSPSSFGAGASGGGMGGSGASDSSFSRDSSTDAAGLADRARNVASNAGEKLSDVGSTVRDRAGSLKQTLANALESGAERLRTQ